MISWIRSLFGSNTTAEPLAPASSCSTGGCGCGPAKKQPDLSQDLIEGFTLLQSGRRQEALEAFERAIRETPDDPRAFHGRGLIRAGEGEHQQAIQDFNESLRMNSKQVAVFLHRGLSSVAIDDHEQAVQDFTKVIRLNPVDAATYLHRAASYLELGELDRAQDDIDEGLTLVTAIDDELLNEDFNEGNDLPIIAPATEQDQDDEETARLRDRAAALHARLHTLRQESNA